MAKLTLTDLTSLANETSFLAQLNQNFADIEAAIEITLSRTGLAPNTMSADLDMNSNDILNAGQISCSNILIDGLPIVGLAEISAQVLAAQDAVSDAEAARDAAELAESGALAAKEAAELAASSLSLPTIAPGDAGKALLVNATEDGYEYSAPIDPAIAIANAITDKATAEAGVDNTELMTPLRTKQAMKAQIEGGDYPGSQSLWGTFLEASAVLAATALVGGYDAGSQFALTAGGLSQAIKSVTGPGKLRLGNVLIQWGTAARTGKDTLVTFPISFGSVPTVIAMCEDVNNAAVGAPTIGSTLTTTQVNFRHGTNPDYIHWVAFGTKYG